MAPLAPYVDTSAAHLGLTLLRGRLDVAQFQCFDQMTLRDEATFVELTVIGASHVLTFGHQGTVLSELLACVPPPGRKALFSKAPGTLDAGDFRQQAGSLEWTAKIRRLQTTTPWRAVGRRRPPPAAPGRTLCGEDTRLCNPNRIRGALAGFDPMRAHTP